MNKFCLSTRILTLIIGAFWATSCQMLPDLALPTSPGPGPESSTFAPLLTPTLETLPVVPAPTAEIFPTAGGLVNAPAAQPGATPANIAPVPFPDRSETMLPCNRASAGHPLDITIPDGTVFAPGEPFTKVWRIINRGNCTWTEDYRLVWFSGTQLAALDGQTLPREVKPGESVDISLEMKAPDKEGSYQGNWKLANANQELFGIGPAGESPFWVFILVQGALPPAVSAVETEPVQLESSGSVQLFIQESYDFDAGSKGNGAFDDVVLQIGLNDRINLETLQPAQVVLYGLEPPTRIDCESLDVQTNLFPLTDLPDGMFFCLRTSSNFPGYVRLIQQGDIPGSIQLDYRLWLNP